MDNNKIKVPEDFPGTGNGGPGTPVSEVEKDPEVLAEKKKNKLLHLRLERYKEIAGTVATVLQTFKAEAMSLTSGIGTLVLGWFQIKKWVLTGHKDVKHIEHKNGHDTRTVVPKPVTTHGTTGYGYGAGTGRLGSGRRTKTPTAPNGEELMAESPIAMIPDINIQTMFTDPMTYVPVLTLAVFIWSSWKAWLKKKSKQLESKGEPRA